MSQIVRWSLGKTDHFRRGRKEPCTRATPRGSRSCTRHRSALATDRLHNRQWPPEATPLRAVVNAFSWGRSAWALHAICEVWTASKGVSPTDRAIVDSGVVSGRSRHTWETPKDRTMAKTERVVNKKSRELDANGSGSSRGPCPAPLGPPGGKSSSRTPPRNDRRGPEEGGERRAGSAAKTAAAGGNRDSQENPGYLTRTPRRRDTDLAGRASKAARGEGAAPPRLPDPDGRPSGADGRGKGPAGGAAPGQRAGRARQGEAGPTACRARVLPPTRFALFLRPLATKP